MWSPGSPDGLFGGTSLPGAQRPDENTPKSLAKPAEDAGLYQVLPAKPGVTFNMHHFNATGTPILKEAWTNLWWESDATVRVYGILGLDLLQVATMSIAPTSYQPSFCRPSIARRIAGAPVEDERMPTCTRCFPAVTFSGTKSVPSNTASPGSHLRIYTGTPITALSILMASRYSPYTGATPAFTHHMLTGIIVPGLAAAGYSRRRRT